MTTKKEASYQVPKGEENHIHVRLRVKQYDPNTGQPMHKPFIQKFEGRGWEGFLRHRNGLEILEVLHAPKDAKTVADSDKEQKDAKAKELRRAKG